MVKFGPSGNSSDFYAAGYKSTVDTPKWLKSIGLDAFEYSFGRGINMSDETAQAIGQQMTLHGIEASVHAPYYINLANPDDEAVKKSYDYIINSLKKARLMGGKRCVIHSGSLSKGERGEVLERISRRFDTLLEIIEQQGLSDMILCPETMGRYSQVGTVEEIVNICKKHPMLIPCLDFGHINSYMQGALKSIDDFRRVMDTVYEGLGDRKATFTHMHFSKIMYGQKGEIKHLNFEDPGYGPEFESLARVLKEYDANCVIICESATNMSKDALTMKRIYNSV